MNFKVPSNINYSVTLWMLLGVCSYKASSSSAKPHSSSPQLSFSLHVFDVWCESRGEIPFTILMSLIFMFGSASHKSFRLFLPFNSEAIKWKISGAFHLALARFITWVCASFKCHPETRKILQHCLVDRNFRGDQEDLGLSYEGSLFPVTACGSHQPCR